MLRLGVHKHCILPPLPYTPFTVMAASSIAVRSLLSLHRLENLEKYIKQRQRGIFNKFEPIRARPPNSRNCQKQLG